MTAKQGRKIIVSVFRESHMGKFYILYLGVFFLVALIMTVTDRNINNYFDALWYCFVSATTIGFGDVVPTGLLSRLLTVFIYLYTAGLLAITTALFTQSFIEIMKYRKDESMADFWDKLEHLPELSKEELEEISARIKEKRKQ